MFVPQASLCGHQYHLASSRKHKLNRREQDSAEGRAERAVGASPWHLRYVLGTGLDTRDTATNQSDCLRPERLWTAWGKQRCTLCSLGNYDEGEVQNAEGVKGSESRLSGGHKSLSQAHHPGTLEGRTRCRSASWDLSRITNDDKMIRGLGI